MFKKVEKWDSKVLKSNKPIKKDENNDENILSNEKNNVEICLLVRISYTHCKIQQ
jgi:hypothetical protein